MEGGGICNVMSWCVCFQDWCSSLLIVLTFVTLHLTSRCWVATLRQYKYFNFYLEIFSVKKYSLLAILYLVDVNVLKFQTYLLQFNLIKPNCPLKCRYENCLVLVVHSDVQIVALCPTNLKNWDLYLTFYSKVPPVHSLCPTKSLPSSVNIGSNIFRPAWPPLLMMAG